MDMNLSKLWERVEERGAWHAVLHGISESDIETEQQQQIHLLKLIFRAGVQWSLFPYKNGRKMGKKKVKSIRDSLGTVEYSGCGKF